MDVSRFVRGLSAPPSIGAHPPAPATVANAGKASAPAEVRVGPLNQRNHPYMFLRPLSHLIWPGNGNNHNNSNNNTRKEKKFQEGLVESLEAATLIKEDEEEEMKLTRVLKGLGVERENLLERHAAEPEESTSDQEKDEGWVMKILRVRSIWEDEGAHRTAESEPSEESNGVAEDQDVGCAVDDDDVEEIVFDRDSFGVLLKKVSLDEAKVYAKMSYLCNLAYCIQRIKPQNLLKFHRLKFITSSLNTKTPVNKPNPKPDSKPNPKPDNKPVNKITASSAYNSVASAASYLQSNSDWTPPVRGRTGEASIEETTSSVTDSVTAVVSANEETKEEIVKDLNFGKNSPCEWFVCDDEKGTRFFVIQGSESLPSWQANLLFEPVQFEGTDVLVHRGIYEAAKGIFSQMLPFITASSSPASSAKPKKLQFTGHSLGGSLSLLISLMLVTRGVVPACRMLPAVTFGAPAVMCGGDYLLSKLGLGKNHLHAITMHRDIVPRAFACNYPDNVARILKAVNGKFRDHPCLTNQKLLYAPMGKLVILQPDEKHSPPHHLLPPGCGLYLFNGLKKPDSPLGLLKAAQSAFMNSPHPLEILSDRSAYGPEGTVFRDHDMNSYLKSLKCVIRQEVKLLRKNKKQSQHVWRPLVVPSGADPCVIMGPRGSTLTKVDFSGLFRGGRENFGRFKRLVASRHVHLLVLVFLPARLLILGLFNPLLA